MQCNFCDNPAAHPSTGQQYTPTVIACRDCTVRFNTWMLAHVNGSGRGRKQARIAAEFQPAMSFYEAAALFPSTRNTSQR